MSLTQDASTGDTVIVVSCYVEGLKVGDFIALNGAEYEVVGLAVPSSRRSLTAALPITLETGLTGAVSSGDLVQAVRSPSPPPPPPSSGDSDDDDEEDEDEDDDDEDMWGDDDEGDDDAKFTGFTA